MNKTSFDKITKLETMIVVVLYFVLFSIGYSDSPYDRAKKLASQMSIEEQLLMVGGSSGPYVGNVPSQPKYGIPELHLEDGPQGVADGTKNVTCWPNALSAVSTWDLDLMQKYASGLAEEQRTKGTNIMLGPMVNIARVPFDGRNFESMGEDPFLSSVMVTRNIEGIQSRGVMGCVKHYLNNNQEDNRDSVSAIVDERTEHEIYLPPFEAAIKNGRVGSVMCSYNKINGTYACENEGTLTRYLRDQMGFNGFVMSDWGATHSTVDSANNGLDMEMPTADYFGTPLAQAVKQGDVSKDRIQEMVVNILTPMFAIGIMDTPQTGDLSMNAESEAHTQLSQHVAEQSTVLLKNDDQFLPLSSTQKITIAILGDDGNKSPTVVGGGSGQVICPYIITPYEGIKTFYTVGNVTYAPTSPIDQAVKLASEADIAIVFVSTDSSEGSDRTTLGLGTDQDNLVEQVVATQPNTAVVVHGPGAVLMPWKEQVKSIVFGWLPGQQDGAAIANILFGEVNPGGKLPLTFPVSDSQTPLQTQIQYPGVDGVTNYTEKLLVGYRWYDSVQQTPLFPFGYGLSYTSFNYSNMKISYGPNNTDTKKDVGSVFISMVVQNTGKVSGREVVQMYLQYPNSAGEPPKVLRGFYKTEELQPNHAQKMFFEVDLNSPLVSVWNTTIADWSIVKGTFGVLIGSSSRDIRLNGKFEIH